MALLAGGRVQQREVSGGTHFGCLPFEQHFGLGTEVQTVDAIDIWWPSGARQRVAGPIAANHTIQITEGDDRLVDVYASAKPRKPAAIRQGHA